MVDIIKYSLGEIRYCNCLDEEQGLPSLADKSYDIGYTDYPWNVKMQNKNEREFSGRTLKWDESKVYFNDDFDQEWNLLWFKELERICNGIIILIPEKWKKWWYRNTDPRGDLIIHWSNGFSASSIARHSQKSTYLFYGKFNNRLHADVIDSVLMWGFLKEEKWVHPSPKGTELALKILKQIKPTSLIDPFAGSGSFLKAADILDISWLGYELDIRYKADMDKRFSKRSIKEWCNNV